MITPLTEFRVHFDRRNARFKNPSPKEVYPIEIEAYLPADSTRHFERKFLPTKIKIKPEQWYKGTKEGYYVNRKHQDYHRLNNQIRATLEHYKEIEQKFLLDKKPFHLEYLTIIKTDKRKTSFTDYWEGYLNRNPKKILGKSALKENRQALRNLRNFKSNIEFYELTPELLDDYEIWLADRTYIRNNEEYNYKPSYIFNQFKCIKAAYNKAVSERVVKYADSPFHVFKFSRYKKMIESEIRYLTQSEVQSLENLKFSKKYSHLSKVCDMFLFSCYTGLRHCDASRLTKKNFEENGLDRVIKIDQQKTKAWVSVSLDIFDKKAYYIYKKWEVIAKDKLFKGICNQYANRSLKEIAKLAGIEKNLTYHMARHTCATSLLSSGVNIHAVQQVMGHASIVTTEKYAKLIPSALRSMLSI